MLQAYNGKMRLGCEALSALVGVGLNNNNDSDANSSQAVELTNVDAANSLPEFDFRCQSAKLLMECSTALRSEQGDSSTITEQTVECSDAAIQVLASLLAENDEVIEVWYLMGCAHAAASPPDVDAAAQYWGRALELLSKMKDHLELISANVEGDDQGIQEVNDQIQEVRKRLQEIGHDTDTGMDDVEMNA